MLFFVEGQCSHSKRVYLWALTRFSNRMSQVEPQNLTMLVRPLWDIRCWAFLNLRVDRRTLRRPLCPEESQDLSNPFTFRLITLSFKPLTFFLPNYACRRKPHQTPRLAYVCKQLGRSVPTSCLILFSCRPAARQCEHKGAFCSCYLTLLI